MEYYGLAGRSLKHNFSAKIFTEKFDRERLDARYDPYELDSAAEIPGLFHSNKHLIGLNVTIPFKENVIGFLDELTEEAKAIGAVNSIAPTPKGLKGHNTDALGFRKSLLEFLPAAFSGDALILGTGGSSKAVRHVLENLPGTRTVKTVSRVTKGVEILNYTQLNGETVSRFQLLVNCTPCGMFPELDSMPAIPLDRITKAHFLYDLVYNPAETALMRKFSEKGGKVCNGLAMLQIQAEESWKFWQKMKAEMV